MVNRGLVLGALSGRYRMSAVIKPAHGRSQIRQGHSKQQDGTPVDQSRHSLLVVEFLEDEPERPEDERDDGGLNSEDHEAEEELKKFHWVLSTRLDVCAGSLVGRTQGIDRSVGKFPRAVVCNRGDGEDCFLDREAIHHGFSHHQTSFCEAR